MRHPNDNPMRLAAWYQRKFGRPLRGRLAALMILYPNVREPDWLSWEGGHYTGADTTAKLRALALALDAITGDAITEQTV